MKIKRIEVKNYKAISEQIADFNGCSAIVTAGNDKGKTSLLRGLIDRFRGEKAEVILKEGEEKGYNIIELTDGCRIEWAFNGKTESFAFITQEGIKMTTGVLKQIGARYFGTRFDIDEFLNSGPSKQGKIVANLVGLDFDKIDSDHKLAYSARTDSNRELDLIIKNRVDEPEKVEKPDIDSLKENKLEIEDANLLLKSKWNSKNEATKKEVDKFNNEQDARQEKHDSVSQQLKELTLFKESVFAKFIDFNKCNEFLSNITEPKVKRVFTQFNEPDYKSTDEITEKIEKANYKLAKFESYEKDLTLYNEWVKKGKQARQNVDKLNKKLDKIKSDKAKMINSASIPEEFQFTEDGILYKGLPLDTNQISSSAKYIAALKLGAMFIGEIKSMHFDASFMDKNSIGKVQKWADENDFQLLIERPDYDGGEIKYKIIS